ncbi:MAG TPA: hypothetical protein VLE99_02385 [Candidatus Saccharimonadales bacterium]|nr:hypothetical protein [Candidatus Saccharimonadales bacterium]
MNQEQQKQLSTELNFKLVLLQQRAAVLDELFLHLSTSVDTETAEYYVQVMNRYGNFFNAIIHSLRTSLYIELLAILGVKLNKNGDVIADRHATASIYNLAILSNREDEYLELVEKHKTDIALVDKIRHHLAHAATSLDELNKQHVPGHNRVVSLLNGLAGFVMTVRDELHGIPGLNKPYLLEDENPYADDTERLISALALSSRSEEMRAQYIKARSKMRKKSEAST